MGLRLEVGGIAFEPLSFSVTEEITPITAGDSSGSVGSFQFSVLENDSLSPLLMSGAEVKLADSNLGSTLGTVTGVNWTDNGRVQIECQSRLGKLNIYDVQAQPYVGTLEGAFRYYAGLAGQFADVFVDPAIASRPVAFPGWFGELWFRMKQFAAAQDCEISLVSGVILLRPLRTRTAVDNLNVARSRKYGDTNLARSVEIYHYSNTPITNKLVYPPNGWVPETQVLSVNADEEQTFTLELSASVSSIMAPVMQTFVAQDFNSSSVYTVVGSDGLPIQPAQWTDYGGIVRVTINPDTTSLSVYFKGATGIIGANGEPLTSYSLALGSDFTGNRYSTLRIVGTGVSFDKQLLTLRTGVPDSMTGTEVGVTIDNPFISNLSDAYTAGTRASRWYAGEKMTLSGSVISINRSGDLGDATFVDYQYDQDYWDGYTYGDVEDQIATYAEIYEQYQAEVENDFQNQVFGNTGGARIWDRPSLRWFRIRSGNISRMPITFEAEDDLTHLDVTSTYDGLTYAQERAKFPGFSYSQRDRSGLKV